MCSNCDVTDFLKATVKMNDLSPIAETVELPEEALEWYMDRMGSLMTSDRLNAWAETSDAVSYTHLTLPTT